MWKNVIINGNKTKYMISDKGESVNIETGNTLSNRLIDGYIRTKYIIKDKYRYKNTARVMLESFYGKSNETDILYFKDGDVTNLSLDNIDLVSIK